MVLLFLFFRVVGSRQPCSPRWLRAGVSYRTRLDPPNHSDVRWFDGSKNLGAFAAEILSAALTLLQHMTEAARDHKMFADKNP
jgi:hypothetical protein